MRVIVAAATTAQATTNGVKFMTILLAGGTVSEVG
jgi:hypothetical protein